MGPRSRTVGTLTQALFVGLVAGFLEVAVLAVTKYAGLAVPEGRLALGVVGQRHGYLWLSPHVVWMAPVAYATIALLVAGGVAAAGRVHPRLGTAHLRLGAPLAVALTSVFWIYPRLHPLAGAILAAGLAVQITRYAQRHHAGWRRLVRRMTPVLAVATALVAGVMLVGPVLAERRAIRALPAPAVDRPPNIVLVILDTVRAASLSLYGYARSTTPNLDRRSTSAVVFDRAYSTSPWTLPAHVSVFTGRWPYEFRAGWFVPYEGEHPTLAEVLRSRGYVTAGFVANTVYAAWESGLDRGFIRYEDYPVSAAELLLSSGLGRKAAHAPWIRRLFGYYDILDRKTATDVTDDFLKWHERSDGRPYFAFLNYLDAHEPYLPPAALAERFGPQAPRRPELHTYQIRRAIRLGRQDMPPEELQAELDAYDATISYLDQELDRLFRTLEDRGDLDNTIVVVTSDHGEQFGEHGLHLHGNALYDPVVRVPLALWFGDRLPSGIRVAQPISTREIPATLAWLATGAAAPFPGLPLSRYWQDLEPGYRATNAEVPHGTEAGAPDPDAPDLDAPEPPEGVEAEFTDIRGAPIVKSITAGRYRYIWSEQGTQELFDLIEDPRETRNLVGEPAHRGTLQRMRRLLAPHVRNDSVLWQRLPQS